MGNWWMGVSEEKLRQAELGLFANVGISDHVQITDVQIWPHLRAETD